MTEKDAVSADELKRFCQQFIKTAQIKSWRTCIVGSHVELANNALSMRACGLNLDTLNVGRMYYFINCYAFPLIHRVPIEYNGLVLRFYTHGVHPGYARLIEESSGEQFKYLTDRSKLGVYDELRGPAILHRRLEESKTMSMHLGMGNIETLIPIQYNIPAVHSPYWPTEASEWITRTRHHACPSKSVIKQVVRYGCDFVGVAHLLSSHRENKNEWRFSFSMAELIIIRSWTSSQRIAYRVLRLVCKIIAQRAAEENKETVLRTYYFKTLMLWACEERPREFWAAHSLAHLIQQLLIEMAEWLTSKFCCNYFIRDNNMMDHLMDTDVSSDVSALYATCASRDLVTRITTLCAADESYANAVIRRSDLPIWIHRCILIQDHVLNTRDSYRDLGANDFSLELQTALVQELTDVLRGLVSQREAVLCDVSREKWLRRAEEHFSAATELHQCTERKVLDLSTNASDWISEFFAEYQAEYMVSSKSAAKSVAEEYAYYKNAQTSIPQPRRKLVKNVFKSKVDSEFRDKKLGSENIQVINPHASHINLQQITVLTYCAPSLGAYIRAKHDERCVIAARRYNVVPGVSPTVNASWFIAKAYLANLYYTQRHFKAVIETCSDVVEVCKHSRGNQILAEDTFPMLLSTQWAAVYDAELQALLGLCSLCAFVSNRTDARSVCLAVCPVLFVLYLKARCALDQGCKYDALQMFTESIRHNKQCKSYFHDLAMILLLRVFPMFTAVGQLNTEPKDLLVRAKQLRVNQVEFGKSSLSPDRVRFESANIQDIITAKRTTLSAKLAGSEFKAGSSSWHEQKGLDSREPGSKSVALKPKHQLDVTIPFSKLKILEKIGSGAYATVYRAHHVDWGCHVALKKFKVDLTDSIQDEQPRMTLSMRREAEICQRLRHASIVSMIGVVFEQDIQGFVLEYVQFGSFINFLKSITAKDGTSDLKVCLKTKMAHEIASGMSYLHNLSGSPIIHGDLKLQNILISDNFSAKISNVGLRKWREYLSSQSSVGGALGTATHIPPEKWRNWDRKYGGNRREEDVKFDVYSFSILLWELFANEKPFQTCSQEMLPALVMRGARPPIASLPNDTSPVIKEIIISCWEQEPRKRLEFLDVVRIMETRMLGESFEREVQKSKMVLHLYLQHKTMPNDDFQNADEFKIKAACTSGELAVGQPQHVRDIARVRTQLVESMRRVDRLVATLYQASHLSHQEQEVINSQPTMFNKADKLLDVICKKPVEAYQCFLGGLLNTQQAHLHELLNNQDYACKRQHRQTLIYFYMFLIEEMEPDDTLLRHLFQFQILDKQELEEIEDLTIRQQKNVKLLDFILRTTSTQYDMFLEALKHSKQEHVFNVLQDASIGLDVEAEMELRKERNPSTGRKKQQQEPSGNTNRYSRTETESQSSRCSIN